MSSADEQWALNDAEEKRRASIEAQRQLTEATLARALSAQPSPSSADKISDAELIAGVANLVRAAWNLCDGTANENPPEVDQADWDHLSAALDRLDVLAPPPGVIAGPGAKVEYALTELATRRAQSAVVGDGVAEAEWNVFTKDHRRHFPYPDGTEIEVTGRDTEYRSNFHIVMRVRSPQWNGHAPYIAWWRVPAAKPKQEGK